MMKRMFLILSSVLMITLSNAAMSEGFYLSSTEVHGQISHDQVFNGFGCSGKNISPQLSWGSAPSGTKSYAITVYDPDAPTGSGWWHWLVFNIPADVHKLKTGASNHAMPKAAVESITSFSGKGFGGACPPKGDKAHRYIFTVFALDTEKIEQNSDANPALIGYFLNSHAIAKASIMAYYAR